MIFKEFVNRFQALATRAALGPKGSSSKSRERAAAGFAQWVFVFVHLIYIYIYTYLKYMFRFFSELLICLVCLMLFFFLCCVCLFECEMTGRSMSRRASILFYVFFLTLELYQINSINQINQSNPSVEPIHQIKPTKWMISIDPINQINPINQRYRECGRRGPPSQCKFILDRLLGSKKDKKCCIGNTKVCFALIPFAIRVSSLYILHVSFLFFIFRRFDEPKGWLRSNPCHFQVIWRTHTF